MAQSRLLEAHYCNLASQSNIYGLTKFVMPCGMNKILVACLQGKVISLEYQKANPLSREIHFTYIPGDAKIASIDAFSTFSRRRHDVGIRVGITLIKNSEGRMYHYLNIYSEWEKDAMYNLDRIAQGCQTIDLNFVPYQLYHTELVTSEGPETVFLLCGGDQTVHLYREAQDQTLQTMSFTEDDVGHYFPELQYLESNITCISCEYIEGNSHRMTLYGCIDGTVKAALVHCEDTKLVQQWVIQHDSPITSIHLFKLHNHVPCPSFVTLALDEVEETSPPEHLEYNILVTSAQENVVVYRNVLKKGFTSPLILPNSNHYDSVMCSHVTDIDFDGQNEILIGTYGQEMLVYKFYLKSSYSTKSSPEKPDQNAATQLNKTAEEGTSSQASEVTTLTSRPPNAPETENEAADDDSATLETISTGEDILNLTEEVERLNFDVATALPLTFSKSSLDTPDVCQSHESFENSVEESCASSVITKCDNLSDGEFRLEWKRTFPDPVLALDALDITGDGLKEVIVVSLKGVHVMQHNLQEVARLCTQRLKLAQALFDTQLEEDPFQQLLTENISVS